MGLRSQEARCGECGRGRQLGGRVWRCACGGPLSLPLGRGIGWGEIDADEPSLWRYRKALPTARCDPNAYFREGLTPLIGREWAGREVHFKLEHLCPTGSYKDRGSAVMVGGLKEMGTTSLHLDSSGNAGSSMAAYCAAAGIDCTVYVPSHTSGGKLSQIRGYGARLVKVPGTREATAEAAIAAAGSGVYASHNWNPLFGEGIKTLAYELWEENGFRAPAAIFTPMGYGSLVLGLHRGFRELLDAGSIDALPRIFGCQAANCAPLHRAHQAGDAGPARIDPSELLPTMAEGIAASRPIRTREIMTALRESRGGTIAVAEDDIFAALRDLMAMGLYVEPTSAVAPAAARVASSGGELVLPGGRVVIILTGHGLKAAEKIEALSRRGKRP